MLAMLLLEPNNFLDTVSESQLSVLYTVHVLLEFIDFRHLLLQELGGNAWWFDRFLAQHIAIFYYFMTVFMYALSPRMACKYMVSRFICLIFLVKMWFCLS